MSEVYRHMLGLDEIQLRPVTVINGAIRRLENEAESEGHRFIRRLRAEWDAGTNRFDALGEFFLGVYSGPRLLAIGGVNLDPYASDREIARVRHVYVALSFRRSGIGSMLVDQIRARAARTFSVLRLRTSTIEAAQFYERLGFSKTSETDATHRIHLHPDSAIALLPPDCSVAGCRAGSWGEAQPCQD